MKDQPYLEAEKKIQEALKSGATELDLRSMELTDLPKSIGQLTQLTELNLSENQLTALPNSLGQLTRLTELDLFQNQLTTLPEWIGNLIKLERLNIANNKISELPAQLFLLKRLNYFCLHSNKITVLSPEIGQLTNLEILLFGGMVFGGNQIVDIPTEIGKLTKLTALSLRENKISDVPVSLAKLEHLKELVLKDNPLNPGLQSAYDAGLEAVKAYLRSLENAEPLYEAKLVLVGEGGVHGTNRPQPRGAGLDHFRDPQRFSGPQPLRMYAGVFRECRAICYEFGRAHFARRQSFGGNSRRAATGLRVGARCQHVPSLGLVRRRHEACRRRNYRSAPVASVCVEQQRPTGTIGLAPHDIQVAVPCRIVIRITADIGDVSTRYIRPDRRPRHRAPPRRLGRQVERCGERLAGTRQSGISGIGACRLRTLPAHGVARGVSCAGNVVTPTHQSGTGCQVVGNAARKSAGR